MIMFGLITDCILLSFMLFRVVCKTGRVTEPRIGNIVVTVGEATVSWESDFIYQVGELKQELSDCGESLIVIGSLGSCCEAIDCSSIALILG